MRRSGRSSPPAPGNEDDLAPVEAVGNDPAVKAEQQQRDGRDHIDRADRRAEDVSESTTRLEAVFCIQEPESATSWLVQYERNGPSWSAWGSCDVAKREG